MEVVSLTYKVLSGQASASEREQLEQWIAESEGNRREFEDIKLLWEYSAIGEMEGQINAGGFEKVRSRVKAKLAKRRRIRVLCWALVLVIIAVAFFLMLRHMWQTSG